MLRELPLLDEPTGLTSTGRRALTELLKNHTTRRTIPQESVDRIAETVFESLAEVELPPLSSVELIVSEGCNLACDYCFEGNKTRAKMEPATARQAVDFLLESSEGVDSLSILFFGGEPLLNFSAIQETVLYAEERARARAKTISFSMTTNGVALSQDACAFLCERGVNVMVSVDGAPKSHDAHRRASGGQKTHHLVASSWRLLQDAYKASPSPPEVRVTVSPDQASRYFENVRYLAERMNAARITASPAWGVRWRKRQLRRYVRELRRIVAYLAEQTEPPVELSVLERAGDAPGWGCHAAGSSIAVAPDGTILPCSAFLGSPLRQEYALGSVGEGWRVPHRRKEFLLVNSQRGPRCMNCAYAGICSGGCVVENVQATGNMALPSSVTCWMTRANAEAWRDSVCRARREPEIRDSRSRLPFDLGGLSARKRARFLKATPVVSVLMPTFNQAPYIARAIRSVLAQTYDDWELWIVNDASVDDTDQQIAPFLKHRRIHLLENPKNVGEWASVIEATKRCRGKYIAYLHSDDIWYPNHLATLVEYLEKHRDIQIAYTAFHCGGRYARHLETPVPVGNAMENIQAEQDITGKEQEIIRHGNFMLPIQAMHWRECLEKHAPPTRADDETAGRPHRNGDGRLWAKFLADGYRIGFIDVPTAQWIVNGENDHLRPSSSGTQTDGA